MKPMSVITFKVKCEESHPIRSKCNISWLPSSRQQKNPGNLLLPNLSRSSGSSQDTGVLNLLEECVSTGWQGNQLHLGAQCVMAQLAWCTRYRITSQVPQSSWEVMSTSWECPLALVIIQVKRLLSQGMQICMLPVCAIWQETSRGCNCQ